MQGTLPFMAVEILLNGENVPHHPTHNLESIFYMLIWICTMYEGPRNQERVFRNKDHLPIFLWYNNTLGGLGFNSNAKSRHCLYWDHSICEFLTTSTLILTTLRTVVTSCGTCSSVTQKGLTSVMMKCTRFYKELLLI